MENLITQLLSSGLTQKDAVRAIRRAFDMGPVDGAVALQKMGANYQVAFKVLSAPYIEAKDAAATDAHAEASRNSSPGALLVIGILLFVGGWLATKFSYHDAVENGKEKFILFKGLFVAGALCLARAAYVWVRG